MNIQEMLETKIDTFVNELVKTGEKKIDKEKMQHALYLFQKNLRQGFTLLFEKIPSFQSQDTYQQCVQEMQAFLTCIDTKEKIDDFLHHIEEGKTIREIFSFSSFLFESLFTAATLFFKEQKWEESIFCFETLSCLDSHNYKLLLLLGFSYFHAKRYQEALLAYAAAAIWSHGTDVFLYCIECYEQLGDSEKICLCAETGLNEELKNPNQDHKRVELFQHFLNKHKKV